jgi:tungstate transport system permease protein
VVEASTIAGAATARSGISAVISRSVARTPEINQARMDNFTHIIGLSLGVSLCAAALATVVGLSLGAALAVYDFPGRRVLVVLSNAFFGLPPVAVGLALYLLLSRSGPLGLFGLLFTPGAMVLAQATLATPIVTALVHRAVEDAWRQYGGALMVDGASRLRAIPHLLAMERIHILTATLAGFGRTISEVGAILIVGGNIAGYTRTMTTAIVLETSEGNLAFALGLGIVLIGISITVSAAIFTLGGARQRP